MTNTTNYAQLLPSVGGSASTWGVENNNLHILWDQELFKTLYLDGSRAMTGPLKGCAPAAGGSGYASVRLPHGAAPTTNLTNGDLWSTTGGLFARINGTTRELCLLGGANAGKLTTAASAPGGAGFNLPSGAAPSSPAEGDLWYDGAELKFRGAASSLSLTSGVAVSAGKWTTARSIAFSGGDVTGNTGSFDGSANVSGVNLSIANNAVTTAKVNDKAVTLAKLADMATASFLARASASTGAPEIVSAAAAAALLNATGAINLSAGAIGTGAPASNYVKLGSIYLMWGSTGVGSEGDVSVALPLTAPNAVVFATAIARNLASATDMNIALTYVSASSTTITFNQSRIEGSSSQSPTGFNWFAVVY